MNGRNDYNLKRLFLSITNFLQEINEQRKLTDVFHGVRKIPTWKIYTL